MGMNFRKFQEESFNKIFSLLVTRTQNWIVLDSFLLSIFLINEASTVKGFVHFCKKRVGVTLQQVTTSVIDKHWLKWNLHTRIEPLGGRKMDAGSFI